MYRTGARVLFATWVGAIASLAAAQKPMRVSIDIKPGDTVTTLEADRGGMLPIALLSTAQFDAALADPATIRVGPSGSEAEPFRTMREDVNRDGRMDLLVLVRMDALNVSCGVTSIRLTGKTSKGVDIEGPEAVTVEGCKPQR